jgi:hypothetical protein
MDNDARYIGKSFFDIILDLMCDDMSLPNRLFSIDEEMELDNTIESTLADDTGIDIEYFFVLRYIGADSGFHIRIIHFIEELTDRRPTDMIDVVAHKKRREQSCPISCRSKGRTRK